MSFELDTRKFEGAINEMASLSSSSTERQVWYNARAILRSIAWNSPRRTGAMNAGWLPSWKKLKMSGRPNTKLTNTDSFEVGKKKKRIKHPAGRFDDNRKSVVPHIIMHNLTTEERSDGKKIYYPAFVANITNFMERAEAEIADKFERNIQRMLERNAKRSGF